VAHDAYTTYARQFKGDGRAAATTRLYRALLFREILRRIVSRTDRETRQRWDGKNVALLIGSDDPVFGASFFRYTEEVAFEVLPDCGHFTIDEQPLLTNAAIRRFLLPPAPGPAAAGADPWGGRLGTVVGRDPARFRERLSTVALPRRRRRFRAVGETPSTVAIPLASPSRR
jgi:hypothetical protein